MAALPGAELVLVFHPGPRALAQVFLFPLHEPVLVLNLHAVRDPAWGFAHEPTLKVTWRYAARVKSVRFSTVKSYAPSPDAGAQGPTVRVDVELEGAPPLALEAVGFSMGPIVVGPPVQPAYAPQWGGRGRGGGNVPMA